MLSRADLSVPSPRRTVDSTPATTSTTTTSSTSSAARSIAAPRGLNATPSSPASLSYSWSSSGGGGPLGNSTTSSAFGTSPSARPRRQSITLSPPPSIGPVPIPPRQGYIPAGSALATGAASPTPAPYGLTQPSNRLSFSSSSPIDGGPLGPIPFRGQGQAGSAHNHYGHAKSSSASLSNLGSSPRENMLWRAEDAGGGVSTGGPGNLARTRLERRGSYRRSFDAAPLTAGERSNLIRRQSGLEALQAAAPMVAVKKENVEGAWLRTKAGDILDDKNGERPVVSGQMAMPEAVDILLKGDTNCLLVELESGSFAFFDYADLNTFLLLVLHATSNTPASSRSASQTNLGKDAQIAREAIMRAGPGAFGASDSAIADENESSLLDERATALVLRLRRGDRVAVRDVCDISQKNPYQAFSSDTPLSTILPLFASGLHRVAISSPSAPPRVLNDLTILEHLLSLPAGKQPELLSKSAADPSLGMAMHPLISLPGTASILDAMQVLSLNGLSAIGVLSGPGSVRGRSGSSGSSGSSSGSFSRSGTSDRLSSFVTGGGSGVAGSPRIMAVSPSAEIVSPLDSAVGVGAGCGELIGVVTVQDCARLVVPSEGRQALGMGLEAFVKTKQSVEQAGTERGEERVRVHTIAYTSTLAHAAGLILATACCRIFLRLPTGHAMSPPASPAPSLTASQSSPPASPLISSLSLSDKPFFPATIPPGTSTQAGLAIVSGSGLPPPPPTQLSPHYVVSTLDILAALARRYHAHLTPPPGLRHLDDVKVVHVAGDESPVFNPGSTGTAGQNRLRGSIMLPGPSGRAMAGAESGWMFDPAALSKKRASMAQGAGQTAATASADAQESGGFDSWRWAGRIGNKF